MPETERRVRLQSQYSGGYRAILNLSEPWVASPELDKPQAIASTWYQHPISQNTLPPTKTLIEVEPTPLQTVEAMPFSPRKGKRRLFADLLHRLADKINGEPSVSIITTIQPVVTKATTKREEGDEVPLREWKAWGYYACPLLHGCYCPNYPPASQIPPSVNVEEVFRSLMDGGVFHPERWIRGLQHPAIPPRPTRWKDPSKGAPLPFPWQCQLNPLLQHFTFGRPPIDWDICNSPLIRCYLGRTGEDIIPLSPADRAQPATFPFVTHMYINALGDDPYPESFWPFYVVNEHGVTVGDVLHKVYENFQQYTSVFEFNSWSNFLSRQQIARIAFEMRGGHALEQKSRRLDILGTQCQFRGLEPHPNREGWTMFLGLG